MGNFWSRIRFCPYIGGRKGHDDYIEGDRSYIFEEEDINYDMDGLSDDEIVEEIRRYRAPNNIVSALEGDI